MNMDVEFKETETIFDCDLDPTTAFATQLLEKVNTLGRHIHDTYATKEEVVGTLGTINEALAALVEVE